MLYKVEDKLEAQGKRGSHKDKLDPMRTNWIPRLYLPASNLSEVGNAKERLVPFTMWLQMYLHQILEKLKEEMVGTGGLLPGCCQCP